MGLCAIRAGTEIAANNRHRRIAFLWEVLTQFGIGSPTVKVARSAASQGVGSTAPPCEFYLDLLHRAANSTSFYCTPPQKISSAISVKTDNHCRVSDTSSIFDERSLIRVSTAPARPLTDIEEFKRSPQFMLLEQSIICSS